jgi:aminopeptidase N
VHDFVWAADLDYRHDTYTRKDGRLLHFYYKKDQTYGQAWLDLQPIMDRALELVEEKIGLYPYQSYSFIQGGDGGMEYPMATLITGNRPLISLVGVAVHEWLHSWFQMVLASNEALYPWMDEGFTAYMEEEIMNQLKAEDRIPGVGADLDPHAETLADFKAFAGTPAEEPLSTHADHFSTSRAYGIGSYVKGALCLHHIRYMVGEKAFWDGMKQYYALWKFRHPNPDDFFRVMEKTSGLELDWFKLYWVNTVKTIDYAISGVASEGKQTMVNLERKGSFPMPVILRVTTKSGKVKDYEIPLDLMRVTGKSKNADRSRLKSWHWVARQYAFKLDITLDEISQIQLDPERMLADVDENNDQWKSE